MRAAFWVRILALTLASLVAACARDGAINRAIAVSVEKGPGTRLVLAEHTEFPWGQGLYARSLHA